MRKLLLLFIVMLSYNALAQTSTPGYSVAINESYFTPGDTIDYDLSIGSPFLAGNYFQFALAPIGITSSSQLIVLTPASSTFFSSAGLYAGQLQTSTAVPFGSYLLFARSSNPMINDTVAYITFGPEQLTSSFQESIVGNNEYCFGEQVTLSVDSVILDSTTVDVPLNFPSNNVFWLPFSNGIQDYNSSSSPVIIGLGYSLNVNRDNLPNSSYYINSSNSALLYNQYPNVTAMSSYQGLNDSSDFTISFWVKRDSCSTGALFARGDSTGAGSFVCYLTDSCTLGFAGGFVNQNFQISVKQVETSIDTGWNHVVIQKSSSQLGLYVNNTLEDSEIVLGALSSPQPLGILVGAPMSLLTSATVYPGAYAALDDIGFWSRSLSPSERLNLMNASTYDYTLTRGYSWSTNDIDTSTTFTLLSDTLIVLSVIDDQGISHRDSIQIIVNNPVISGGTQYCTGESATLSVQNNGINTNYLYSWSTQDTTDVIQTIFTSSQLAWVSSQGLTTMCFDSINIIVNANPVVQITKANYFDNYSPKVVLSASTQLGTGNTFVWSTGDSTSVIEVYPNQTSAYSVAGFSNAGCSDIDTTVIAVKQVTFVVDLVNQDITKTPHLAGNITSWNSDSIPLIQVANSDFWSASIPLVIGDTISYKFINGDSWTDPQDSVADCSLNPYYYLGNRYYVVEATTDTVGPFQLSSCSDNPVMELIQDSLKTVCFGDTIKYSLPSYLNTVLWSTLDTSNQLVVPPSFNGTLSVEAFYAKGVRLIDSVVINQDAAIDTSISVNGALNFCEGDTSYISLNPNYAVIWNNQNTSNSLSVSSSDTLYAQLETQLGCIGYTDTLVFFKGLNPPSLISFDFDTICSGEESLLYAPAGYNYLWSTQQTSDTIKVTTTSTVFVIVTDSITGCNSQSDLQFVLVKLSPPVPVFSGDTIVSVGLKTAYVISYPDSNSHYSWIVDSLGFVLSALSDSTEARVEWTGPGTTHLRVRAALGSCTFEYNQQIIVSSIGMGENDRVELSVFPNPSNGLFRINIMSKETVQNVDWKVYDSVGRILREGVFKSFDTNLIDLSSYASGSYVLTTSIGHRVMLHKL